MTEKPKTTPIKAVKKMGNAEQSERFKETARKLGADETGKAFERAFEKIAPPKRRDSD
jgi:hypothetical protein